MVRDELQQAWKSQDDRPRVRVEATMLLKELERNRRNLWVTIFWRDFREVLVALLIVPASWYTAREAGWEWLALGEAGVWIAGFILVDRWRRRGRVAAMEQPIVACVDQSLREVEHQIWLLRNVAWWYLLPGVVASFFALTWTMAVVEGPWWLRAIMWVLIAGFFLAVDYGIYRLNQFAVREELEPRRQELLAVRESLLRAED